MGKSGLLNVINELNIPQKTQKSKNKNTSSSQEKLQSDRRNAINNSIDALKLSEPKKNKMIIEQQLSAMNKGYKQEPYCLC